MVHESSKIEFEKHYGGDGTWAKLFKANPSYIQSELLSDIDGQYILIDKWQNKHAYDSFRTDKKLDYERLSAELAHLYQTEEKIGCFSSL